MVLATGFPNRSLKIDQSKPNLFGLDEELLLSVNNFFEPSQINIDDEDLNDVSREIGLANWYNYRMFIANMLRNIREISLSKLSAFFDYHYTFYGFSINEYFRTNYYLKHKIVLNIYDPELDDSGFSDDMKRFKGIDEEWLLEFGQNMFDQNSYNFKEFLKVLSDLRTRLSSPNFALNRVKIKRSSQYVKTSDGRINITFSEEISSTFKDWVIDFLLLMGILLAVRAISPQFFASTASIVIENLFRVDISLIPGKAVNISMKGLRSVTNILTSKLKPSKAAKKFVLTLFKRDSSGKKGKRLLSLPEFRNLLPDEQVRKRLPPSRPG